MELDWHVILSPRKPRQHNQFTGRWQRHGLLLLLLFTLASCNVVRDVNPTVFDYSINTEELAANPPKKLILATASLGAPTRVHLAKGEHRVKAMVADYLRDAGFTLLPDYHFENAWKQALRNFGEYYDPTTGRVDIETWKQVMVATGEYLRTNTDADAIVFADVIELETQHSPGINHYARWDGVTRKPRTTGTGGVPVGFEWTQIIKAASLQVTIYNTRLERLFTSRGGIETLQEIDLRRADPSFQRRKKLLRDDGFIEEGIELAFHPFIPMKNYPAPSP